MHGEVACFLQEGVQLICADAFHGFAQHAAADASQPCAVKLIFQSVLVHGSQNGDVLAQSADAFQIGGFFISVTLCGLGILHDVKEHIAKTLLDLITGKSGCSFKKRLVFRNIQTLLDGLVVLGEEIVGVKFPLVDVFEIRFQHNYPPCCVRDALLHPERCFYSMTTVPRLPFPVPPLGVVLG